MSVHWRLTTAPMTARTPMAPTLAAVKQGTHWMQMDSLAMVCIANA